MKSTPFLASTYKRIATIFVQVIKGSNGEPKPSRIVVSDKQAEIYNSTDRQTDITDGPSSIEINTLQFSSFSESANRSFSRDRKLNPGILASTYKRIATICVQVIKGSNGEPI
jgi:hypothetical protein